jgi:hypothetical protein
MNLVTTLLGAVLFAFGYVFYASNAWPGLLAAFIISTLVEGGILVLFKRAPHRRNWIAALAANLVSYAVLAVILLLS